MEGTDVSQRFPHSNLECRILIFALAESLLLQICRATICHDNNPLKPFGLPLSFVRYISCCIGTSGAVDEELRSGVLQVIKLAAIIHCSNW